MAQIITKDDVQMYVTPAEEEGTVTCISTEGMTDEQFTAIREEQNQVMIEGDIGKYFDDPDDAPLFVSAGIGGSEVGILTGTSDFQDLTEFWRIKLGITKRVINSELKAIFAAGHFYEFFIAKKWCEDNYYELLKPTGMLVSKSNPAYFMNVDFYARSIATGEVVILEIKYCAGSKHQQEVLRRVYEELPAEPKYDDQVQYQMYLSGVHKGFVVYGWCGSPRAVDEKEIGLTYAFEVVYNQERVDQILWCIDTFVESLVQVDETMLLTLPGASPKDFTMVYGEGSGELVTDDKEHQDAADRWIRATQAISSAEELAEKAEKDLLRLLGSNKSMIIRSGSTDLQVTTKVRESKNWDMAKLSEVAPEVYADNTKFSITEAQLKKLPEDTREDVLSCLTVERKPVAGITIKTLKK